MKTAFISCSASKLDRPTFARNLYSPSTLFRFSLEYCLENYDKVYILSAKYGLVELDDVLEPYNLTLNKMSKFEIDNWALGVSKQILQKVSCENELFFHCGERYRSVIKYLDSYKINCPMKGLGIGRQLGFYKKHLKNSSNLTLF